MVVLLLVVVFAGVVAFQLAVTRKGWGIARKWRAPNTSWRDLPLAAKAFALICGVAGLAVGVLLAAVAHGH
jgi:hypothetical protein